MPTLSIAPELSVDAVMEMTRRHWHSSADKPEDS
jgi:hypothetical protein